MVLNAVVHLWWVCERAFKYFLATLFPFPLQPAELADLVRLTELDISENEFKRFPEVVFLLPNLQRLNLSDNDISSIPE